MAREDPRLEQVPGCNKVSQVRIVEALVLIQAGIYSPTSPALATHHSSTPFIQSPLLSRVLISSSYSLFIIPHTYLKKTIIIARTLNFLFITAVLNFSTSKYSQLPLPTSLPIPLGCIFLSQTSSEHQKLAYISALSLLVQPPLLPTIFGRISHQIHKSLKLAKFYILDRSLSLVT